MWSPLNCKSHYSELNGFWRALSKPEEIVSKCIELGYTSCGLTDIGSISGTVEFWSLCKKKNIKPLLGSTLNVDGGHLIILARNLAGWKKLIKLTSISNRFDNVLVKKNIDLYRPTAKLDLIDDDFVVILCNRSNLDKVEEYRKFKHLYVGLNKFTNYGDLEVLAKKYQVKTVAFCDPFYTNKEDAEIHRILICMGLKTTFKGIESKLQNEPRLDIFFNSDSYYLPSQDQIKALYSAEEIKNTEEIVEKIELYDVTNKPDLPPFPTPNGQSGDDYLRELCRIGWKQKIQGKIPKEKEKIYIDRVKEELDTLTEFGLSNYFLITQDYIAAAHKRNEIVGIARGSCGGSLVAYLTNITKLDPVKYDLIFSRFINRGRLSKDRISYPDVDTDFPIYCRDNVVDYIKTKYGQDKVAGMATFGSMMGRGALKEVLRIYNACSFEEMNRITEHIPDEAKIADDLQEMDEERGESSILRWSLENNSKKLKDWCYLEEGKLVGPMSRYFDIGIKLEGTKKSQGKHASGWIIGSSPLEDLYPMIYDKGTKGQVCGFPMEDIEKCGGIKTDVLGVAALDKIQDCINFLTGKEED